MGEEGLGVNTEWLRDVRQIYLAGASRKLAELERAILGLEMNPGSSAHERRLRLLLHNLIGSGASYGFPDITDTARGMSECLKRGRDGESALDSSILTSLRAQLNQLRTIFNEAAACVK